MLRSLRRAVLPLLASCLPALFAGCYGKANNSGLLGELSMGTPGAQNEYGLPPQPMTRTDRPVPVGQPVRREVFRYTAHWSSCSLDEGCGSLSAPLAALELISCDCPEDACACSVAEGSIAGPTTRLELAVTGLKEARTLLHVKVKAEVGEVEDRFEVAFRAADHVGVYGAFEDGASERYASMPGAGFDLRPVLEAADGTQLLSESGAWSVEVEGPSVRLTASPDVWLPASDSYGYYGYDADYGVGASFQALEPGRATVRFRAAGLSREVVLQVGNWSQVTGFSLHVLRLPAYSVPASSKVIDASLLPIDEVGADALGARLTEVGLDAYGSTAATMILELSDGTRAVGGATSLRASSDGIVGISAPGGQTWSSEVDLSPVKAGTTEVRSALCPDAPGVPVSVNGEPSY